MDAKKSIPANKWRPSRQPEQPQEEDTSGAVRRGLRLGRLKYAGPRCAAARAPRTLRPRREAIDSAKQVNDHGLAIPQSMNKRVFVMSTAGCIQKWLDF